MTRLYFLFAPMSPDGDSAIVAGLENDSLMICVLFSKEQGEQFVEALMGDKKKVKKFKADVQKAMLPDTSTRPPVKITGTAARALGVYLTSSGTGDRQDIFDADGASDMPESSDAPPASFDGFVGAAVMSGIIAYDKRKLLN